MAGRVSKVAIVGGGTAGWLTATILSTMLNRWRGDQPPVEVALIESPNIPIIGVGEATVPGIMHLLRYLGIDESQFFLRCNASFKLGVRFVGWRQDASGRPERFIHPFNSTLNIRGFIPGYHALAFGLPEGSRDFGDAIVPNAAVIEALRGPRPLDARDYDNAIGYSYHLDASLFATFLREIAVARGVSHILDDFVEAERDERGFITALELKERGRLPVELVVDCTGFRSLLLQKTMAEPFNSYSDKLLCDSALAVQIPHRDARSIPPCTSSTALGAGWVWRVPLFSRIGTGYVFSSAFRSDEEATREFLDHLAALGESVEGLEPRVIRMRVGRTGQAWVKNCVAIGLSSGFIEPLESTAIHMIEAAARFLVTHFPDSDFPPAPIRSYNRLMSELYEEVRDFIVMHYYTSNRPEPFWQAAREESRVSDNLRANLELWRHALPDVADIQGPKLFSHWSYLLCLACKGYFADRAYPLFGSVAESDWTNFSDRLARMKRDLLARLPRHYDLVAAIRARAEQANASPVATSLPAMKWTASATVPLPR